MHKINIYMHIPFCHSKCHYCELYSEPNLEGIYVDRFIECLKKEIRLKNKKFDFKNKFIIDSITIGGGTPNYLNLSRLKKLMNVVSFFGKPSTYFTVELNPYNCNLDVLNLLRGYGVNRLSFGVQTNNQSILEYLGRSFSKNPEKIIKKALDLGFRVNLDFMIGLPRQKIDDINTSLKFIKDIMPTDVTVLSLRTGTVKMLEAKKFGEIPPANNTQKMYEHFNKKLVALGYSRLLNEYFSLIKEKIPFSVALSNCFTEKMIGFGPYALSCFDDQIIKNVSDINAYFEYISKGCLPCFRLKLSNKIKAILHLMKIEFGEIDLNEYKTKFGFSVSDLFHDSLILCIEKGYISISDSKIILTKKGMDHIQEVNDIILYKNYKKIFKKLEYLFRDGYFSRLKKEI